jgi:membrane-bound serine protease (ClpP class)
MKHLFSFSLMLLFFAFHALAIEKEWKIVQFDIKEDIAPSATRLVQKGLDQAKLENADLVIIHMNTFGGLLTDADSIRTAILNAPFPVYVFIDKNAASAGALISIACDKIFMAPGASIGSATVVDGEGNVLPDKYQSYMRSIMRATAESHGMDTIISGNDTTYKYKRDPMIAEGMVDPRTVVPGVIDSSKVIAFTPQEAIKFGYCEAEVNSIEELLKHEGITNFSINKIEKTTLDKVIGFLSSPVLSGVLIMLIFWGIFFELRTPGIGFPLAAAVVCALLYFAPLYLEGLAANWEILLFFVGIILIGLEIFVIPGFGVAGISGIVLTITSLVLSMVRNINFDFTFTESGELVKALSIVLFALGGFVVGSLLMGKGLMNTALFQRLVLKDTLQNAKANPSLDSSQMADEHFATAHTDLRPMGKIRLGGEIFEAKTLGEFISEGEKVAIIGKEMNSYVVARTNSAIV